MDNNGNKLMLIGNTAFKLIGENHVDLTLDDDALISYPIYKPVALTNDGQAGSSSTNNGVYLGYCNNFTVDNYPALFTANVPIDYSFINMENEGEMSRKHDKPDYIDIKQLIEKLNENGDITVSRSNRGRGLPEGSNSDMPVFDDDDDDDVIFVKEYKEVKKSEEVIRKGRTPLSKAKPVIRKQGKRKSSPTGAVYCPPLPLQPRDLKEWPANGMHEQPTYNPVTKKVEKLPNLSTIPKKPKKPLGCKRGPKRTKTSKGASELATITHKSFYHVLDFVEQVKEYKELTKTQGLDLGSDILQNAEDILHDSSILYCFTNDISQKELADYFNTVKDKENRVKILKSIVDVCTQN